MATRSLLLRSLTSVKQPLHRRPLIIPSQVSNVRQFSGIVGYFKDLKARVTRRWENKQEYKKWAKLLKEVKSLEELNQFDDDVGGELDARREIKQEINQEKWAHVCKRWAGLSKLLKSRDGFHQFDDDVGGELDARVKRLDEKFKMENFGKKGLGC